MEVSTILALKFLNYDVLMLLLLNMFYFLVVGFYVHYIGDLLGFLKMLCLYLLVRIVYILHFNHI